MYNIYEVMKMSNKERIIQLIDNVPDNRLVYIVDILESLKAYANEAAKPKEVEPDDLDLAMIAEAEQVNDGTTISLDEMLAKDGLTHADLQD